MSSAYRSTWWSVFVLIIIAAILRLVIIGWGAPYKENLSHEHSLFYDSRAVVHDQYRVLYGLLNFPKDFLALTTESYMPLLQRYIATPGLVLWLWLKLGAHPDRISNLPFAYHSYMTIIVNRFVSLAGSLFLIGWLAWMLRRFNVPVWLVIGLTAIFSLNPVEIGFAINEKTITLITVVLAIQFTFLSIWYERLHHQHNHSFRYLWLAAAMIGVAGAAREQGASFAGVLFIGGMVWFLIIEKQWRYLFVKWRVPMLITAPIIGLALSSPDWLIKWRALFDSHRVWDWPISWSMFVDMWYLFEILFAGSVGVAVFLGIWLVLLGFFKRLDAHIQLLVLWLPLFVVLQFFYSMKDARFVQPLIVFGFLLIGYAVTNLFRVIPTRRLHYRMIIFIVGTVWFLQSLSWGTSALAFFKGSDNRIDAANDFNRTMPTGTTVAQYFTAIHDREIPIDQKRYHLFAYDPDVKSVYENDTTLRIAEIKDWPSYILIQYESGTIWEPPDQQLASQWREQVRKSGQYDLVRVYPKRSWRGFSWGLYGTHSRWAYLNPTVEVYKKRS